MKKLFTTCCLLLLGTIAFSQVILTDDFNYPNNDSLVANGWVSVSGGNTNAMRANKSGLTYGSPYPGSGNGNSAYLISNGQDAAKYFPKKVTAGTIYASFLVKPDSVRTGDYFFALIDSSTTTNYAARTFIKLKTSGYFSVAISKSNETAVYGTDSFAIGGTYLFVVKYVFNTATATDDSVSLYVLSGNIPNTEPSFATAKPVNQSATDPLHIGRVALRQGSASSAPDLAVDGLRVGTNWFDVVIGQKPIPAPVLNIQAQATGQNSMVINWQKQPLQYADSLHTTLVFVKKGGPVIIGTPTKSPSVYTASSNLANPGTAYQNDSAAYCVMNSDSSSVSLTGLSTGTNYNISIFVVRTADSVYSIPTGGIGGTNGSVQPPAPFKGLIVSFPTPFTADVMVIRDSSYKDSLMTTLAFVKKGTQITVGLPTKATSAYTANPDVNQNGTRYENDSLAKCVYKGDSMKFTVTGLAPGVVFTFMAFVVRDKDTIYSSASLATDSPRTFKPNAITGGKFSNFTMNSMDLTWNRPLGYNDSTMTMLAFIKEATPPLNQGYLNRDPSTYIANSFFPGNGTPFQLDTLAKCVYNGDSLKVTVTGLKPGTNYFASLFAVRKADSNYYSNLYLTNSFTMPMPAPVLGVAVVGTGQNTLNVNWIRPNQYNNLDYQTVVFLKAIDTINGKPMHPAPFFNPSANFQNPGTFLDLDSMAYCVFNGDTNSVSVSGLNLGTQYHAAVYTFRMSDSAWSGPGIGKGNTFGAVAPPAPVVNVQSTNTGLNTGVVAWTKDSTYKDSVMTILVFGKKGGPVLPGVPKKGASFYHDNADWSAPGATLFELDSNARCVYKGDGPNVNLSGLDSMTMYNFAVYVVRDKDSAWSAAMLTNFGTPAPSPKPALNAKIDGVSISSLRISWNKPAGYENAKHSTLVFLKENNPINQQPPTKPVSAYVSSTFFGQGSRYEFDSLAYCVFRADTNFVVVTNLKRGINYKAVIYLFRDGDSTYSPATVTDGNVLPPPPVYPIGAIAKVNPTTGVPDSLNVKVRVRGVCYGYNQRTTGLQVVAIDPSGGITLFRNTGNFGYTNYAEGDSVEAEGSVATFRGLAELNLDTIIVLGKNKPLRAPKKVNIVEEVGENDLLRIDSVKFLGIPPLTWPAGGNVSVTNMRNDTIVIRVLAPCPLAGQPIPTTPIFSVIGLGVQFSSSSAAPFLFNGYQLFPRGTADVIPIVVTLPDTLERFTLTNPMNDTTVMVTNDPNKMLTFRWRKAVSKIPGLFPTYMLRLDTVTFPIDSARFQFPADNSGKDTVFTASIAQMSALAGMMSVPPNTVFKGHWTVVAIGGTFKRQADTVLTIKLVSPPPSLDTLQPFALLLPANNSTLNLQGDTNGTATFLWSTAKSTISGVTAHYNWMIDNAGGNFSSPKMMVGSGNGGLDTTVSVKLTDISQAFGLTPGANVNADWTVVANGNTFIRKAAIPFRVALNRGIFSGIAGINAPDVTMIYPNPANNILYMINGGIKADGAYLLDITGRQIPLTMREENGVTTMDVSLCLPGIYLLQLKYGQVITHHKIQISK